MTELTTLRNDSQPPPVSTRKPRGFAAMNPERHREIASQGGRVAHERGVAHQFTHETGQRAGRLGGRKVAADREHMARIGRLGGQQRSGRLDTTRSEAELTLLYPGPGLELLL